MVRKDIIKGGQAFLIGGIGAARPGETTPTKVSLGRQRRSGDGLTQRRKIIFKIQKSKLSGEGGWGGLPEVSGQEKTEVRGRRTKRQISEIRCQC